ncbi:MAG TPA: hypothetical protein VM307_07670 [Egibacteraceae bacterium]|nr:hypothetical protein [Egibacteraceae bacterium]
MGWRAVQRHLVEVVQWAAAVDGVAEAVEHPPQQRVTDAHGGGPVHRRCPCTGPHAAKVAVGQTHEAAVADGDDLRGQVAGWRRHGHRVADGRLQAFHLEVQADDARHHPRPAGGSGRERGAETVGGDHWPRASRTRRMAGPI